jgi:hypothetical protein
MMYLHMQFQLYAYITTKVNEQKLKISSRGMIYNVIYDVSAHLYTSQQKLEISSRG